MSQRVILLGLQAGLRVSEIATIDSSVNFDMIAKMLMIRG